MGGVLGTFGYVWRGASAPSQLLAGLQPRGAGLGGGTGLEPRARRGSGRNAVRQSSPRAAICWKAVWSVIRSQA